MRPETDQTTHPRLLRKSALGGAADDNSSKVENKSKKKKGSRFVGPALLDEEQRVRIGKELKRKKIGDEMGREIFICALEYQMGIFAPKLERRVEPEQESESAAADAGIGKALRAVVESAANLARLLHRLPDDAQERVTEMLAREAGLWRGYDGRYLCELGLEIERLERACIAAGGEPEPEPEREAETETESTADPAASRELVAKLAEIFSDCFEMKPTVEEGGAFQVSLQILGDVTGLKIDNEPAFLAQVLAEQDSRQQGG